MKSTILFSILFCSSILFGSEQANHKIFDDLLKTYVSSSGKVDYTGLKSQEKVLDGYLEDLKAHGPASDWSLNTKKAYYMNAYNAYTLKFVLLKYPVKSVKDISFSGKDIWELRLVHLGEKTLTLGYVENEILRKMRDPRIHFAINCASYSCPKLANRAFTESNVDSEMTKLTKAYINDPKHNIITEKKVKLSQLFEWYADDFTYSDQTLIKFLNKYSSVQISEDAKVEYLPYNWSLNE